MQSASSQTQSDPVCGVLVHVLCVCCVCSCTRMVCVTVCGVLVHVRCVCCVCACTRMVCVTVCEGSCEGVSGVDLDATGS